MEPVHPFSKNGWTDSTLALVLTGWNRVKNTIAKLHKLRGRSIHELLTRGQQDLAKTADRILLNGTEEMSDEALYREFASHHQNGSGKGTAALLLQRLREKRDVFLPSILLDQQRLAETMQSRFESPCKEILATAEAAIEGNFSLLGYKNLRYGKPIDWHLNPLSGDRAPLTHWSLLDPVSPIGTGDLKVFWEIQRTSHFVTLGQAYWLTRDNRFSEAFRSQVLHWINSNPVGMGLGWSASLDVAFRAISWIWAIHLCADSTEITEDMMARMLKSLIEHGKHIEKYLSTYFSPNTHLTGEALGLFYLGVAFPELRRADKWRTLGLKILLDQLPKQIRTDGVYFEQASYYHRYTVDFYLHVFILIRSLKISLSREMEQLLWRKLEAMCDHLMWIQRPDSSTPLFGDDDGGRLLKLTPRKSDDFRDTLAIGAAIFKRGDWKHAAGSSPAELLWLLGSEGLACYDRLEAVSPVEQAHAFDISGYYLLRDGWDPNSSYVLADCGRHGSEMGPGHAHSDGLAFEYSADGVVWLVDPATFVYGANPQTRNWFRSTEAHNTATVDGEGQSVPAAPFAWQTTTDCQLLEFTETEDVIHFEGFHEGYHRLPDRVTHIRSISLMRNTPARCLIINDKFEAADRHSYAIRYHFGPNITATAEDNRVRARTSSGQELSLSVFGKGVKARVESGWISTCYGERVPAPIAIFEAIGVGLVQYTSVILTHPAGIESNQ